MAELPQETTGPSFARPFYTGNVRTEAYAADALRALGEISIDASIPSGRAQLPMDVNYQDSDFNPMHFPDNDSSASFGQGGLPGDGVGPSQYRGRSSLGEVGDYGRLPATSHGDEHGAFPPQPDVTRLQSFISRKQPPLSSPNTTLRDDLPPLSQQVVSPTPTGGRFTTFPGRRDSAAQMIAEPLSASRSTFDDMGLLAPPEGDAEDAVPKYEAIEGTRTPPPAPPPGAAPPANLYGGYDPGSYDSESPFVPDNPSEKEDDIQLPYMASERRVPFGSRPLPMPRQLAQADREVVTTEVRGVLISTEPDLIPDPLQTPSAPTEEENTPTATAQALTPPPPVEDLDDEQALNAAAAREVSRELDSLMYQPPTLMPKSSPPQTSVPVTLSIPPVASSPPRSSSESVTQPASPFTRSRGRGPGSPQTPRSSTEQPPSDVAPSPYVAQVSLSPKQPASLPPPYIAAALPTSPSPSNTSTPPFRTPPEGPPSPTLMQRSLPQSPAVSHSPARPAPRPRTGAGMISVAAFRRQAPRTGSEPQPSPSPDPRDVSPLSIKKKDLRNSSNAPRMSGSLNPLPSLPGALPSGPVTYTPSEQNLNQEEEFDYLSAYYLNNGGDEESPANPNVLR